jgi:hypothetical protein
MTENADGARPDVAGTMCSRDALASSNVEDRAFQKTLPTSGRSARVVVAFRQRRSGTCRRKATDTAKKPASCLVRLYERRDVALNARWDSLITLVGEAWCWRDPDCVAAVQDCIVHLRRSVDRDWL